MRGHDLLDSSEQLVTGDRLSQVGGDASRNVASLGFGRIIGRVDDGRDLQSRVDDVSLHLESAHVRHMRIEQEAMRRGSACGERLEKFATGSIDARAQPERHAETAQAGANGFFVVDYDDKHLKRSRVHSTIRATMPGVELFRYPTLLTDPG